MQIDAYHAFTQQLTDRLQADERVVGLVLLGSTADASHQPDVFSDHDFFVITQPGEQEAFRTTQDWLPDAERIVMAVRETAHGLKILYDDAHILEFAVFDVAEIALARANDYRIVFDRGGVGAALQQIAHTEAPAITPDDMARHLQLFLTLLVIGGGRVARGESISGQLLIRSHALGHLLPVLAHHLNAPDKTRLDNLDAFRRFEQVFPGVGVQINTALEQDPIESALALLNVCELYLSGAPGYSAEAVKTVRAFLNRVR